MPLADIQKLVARLSLQKGITVESRTIKGANHFFHDSLDKLAVEVDKYVAKCLLNPPGRATSNKEPRPSRARSRRAAGQRPRRRRSSSGS